MAHDNTRLEIDPVIRRTVMAVGIGAVVAVVLMVVLEKIF